MKALLCKTRKNPGNARGQKRKKIVITKSRKKQKRETKVFT